MIRSLAFLFVCFAAAAADPQWISVADKLIATAPESIEFNWGEGVQMSGLMQVHQRTRDDKYAAFVEKWAEYHLPRGLEALLGNQPDSKRKGYCGHWVSGTALVYLNEARPKPAYLDMARGIAGFIRAGATRSPEGAPGHWLGNYQIWVDTLNMTCPLLSRLSKIDHKPEYLEDAVNQLLVAARHMQEPRNGLFYHMWDWQYDKHSPVLWGRGNGWVIMSLADTFEYLPKIHKLYKPLRALALSHAKALVKVQDKEGLWHTVMDDPQSYPECSATTMIAYGLLKMTRLGVLPENFRAPAKKAWVEVNKRWVKGGLVAGVSAGTGPTAKEPYLSKPTGTYTWGTGSYLMAGAEMDRLGK